MPKAALALSICIIFTLWLFYRDRKLRPMTSGWLWITLIWIAIVGSRPVSLWFSAETLIATPEDLVDGSPLNRNIFIFLILAALVALWSRRTQLSRIFASNRWLF